MKAYKLMNMLEKAEHLASGVANCSNDHQAASDCGEICKVIDDLKSSYGAKTETPPQAGMENCASILQRAYKFDDSERAIWEAELLLLRKVAETSSDLVEARTWDEFREKCGGIEPLEWAHAQAVEALEQWFHEMDDGQ